MTASDKDRLPQASTRREVDAFIESLRRTPARRAGTARGRLVFALDATASRGPTWDRAAHQQARMFEAVSSIGKLSVQLCYYRGFREFHATGWFTDAAALTQEMTRVSCRAGYTQIGRVLQHALSESRRERIDALVFVGDCCEEPIEDLAEQAGKLGLLGVPAFVFQEAADPLATGAFERIAALSGGAHCRFDGSSAAQLRDLLTAVAVYSTGGMRALLDFSEASDPIVQLLTRQLPK